MSQWLLEFENIDYTYIGTNKPAISNLNLRIPQGKRCAVIGQNGCGKSTLFLLANGLYKPQKGIIKWQGIPITYNNKSLIKLRQKVGLVFQNPEQQLIATTVEEDISYGLCNLGFSDEEIKAKLPSIMEQFGLNSLRTKPIHQLSLGQKKRVSLAGVMVLQPNLLLLDEPSVYLDALNFSQLQEMLIKIENQGTTIVMATHNLEWVYHWANWIFVLDKGKLILEGTPQEVFEKTEILESLQLNLPLSVELLSILDQVIPSTTISELKQNILNKLKLKNNP